MHIVFQGPKLTKSLVFSKKLKNTTIVKNVGKQAYSKTLGS